MEAWDELTSTFNKKPEPVYCGIGDMSKLHFKYSVIATEKNKDDSEKKCEEYIIGKGNYLTIALKN